MTKSPNDQFVASFAFQIELQVLLVGDSVQAAVGCDLPLS